MREHFKNSKFACDTDEYLPVVFSPPRDGKQLTDPVAVGGHQSGDEEAEAGRKKQADDDDEESSSSSTSTSTSEGGGDADDDGGEGEEALRARMSEVAVSPATGPAAGNGCLSVAGLSAATAPAQAFSF